MMSTQPLATQAQISRHPSPCRTPSSFLAACLASATLLAVYALEWTLVDLLTPFLMPLAWGLAWLAMLAALCMALSHAWRRRRTAHHAWLPLAICLGALLLVAFVPFTRLWLTADFHLKRTQREAVIAEVLSGHLTPNLPHSQDLIRLRASANLSAGGNEIIVQNQQKPQGKTFVFFYSYRGMLNNYSGFLWVPEGSRPEQFQDAGDAGTIIESMGGHWYFIGHR